MQVLDLCFNLWTRTAYGLEVMSRGHGDGIEGNIHVDGQR
jgi:hypothetical protein